MGIKKAIKNRTGFLFMLLILAVLGIVILFYREKFSVLYKYGYNNAKNFIDKNILKNKNVKKQKDKINLVIKKEKEKIKDNIKEKLKDGADDIREKVNDKLAEKTKEILETDKNKPETKKDSGKSVKIDNAKGKNGDAKTAVVKKTDDGKKLRTFTGTIYFNKITNDEKIELVSVKRSINYIDAPLTETLKILIEGPNKTEKANELLSSIPANTKVLSVRVKDNTAFINLSGDFEYNPFGREASAAQVKQIVYTTTEFSNVKKVQFLIDGKIKTYLGGEGIVINKPLTRNDLT